VDKLCSLKGNIRKKDRFFSKLRITGGEPLFSTADTLRRVKGADSSLDTIDYFLRFFESLDPHIKRLVEDQVIFLSPPRRYSDDVPFPTFLCTDDNRMEIRFDTNGFLFGDHKFADRFIRGVYSLFEDNRLNNLLVKMDFSLKGVYPLEVYWSQNQKLPVDERRLGDFKIEDHPQFAGLKNMFGLIHSYRQKDSSFDECFGLTVEPGINNVKRNCMYYEGSLAWKLLETKLREKLGKSFRLSDVDNKMEVRGKIPTHLRRGVAVKVVFNGNQFTCLPTDSEAKKRELYSLLKRLRENKIHHVKIYVPYLKRLEEKCRQLQLRL